MTQEQLANILGYLSYVYPNFKPRDTEKTLKAWYLTIGDRDYQTMISAAMRFVQTDTKGFAPTIGQLIEQEQIVKANEGQTDAEAWALVSRAIGNSAYNAKEEFERLPEAVKRAVGSADQLHSWALDENLNTGVIQSHFLKSYAITKKRETENAALGVGLMKQLELIRKGAVAEIEDCNSFTADHEEEPPADT